MVDTLVLGTSANAWEFESLHAQFKRKDTSNGVLFVAIIAFLAFQPLLSF